jgi:hypothetical protein
MLENWQEEFYLILISILYANGIIVIIIVISIFIELNTPLNLLYRVFKGNKSEENAEILSDGQGDVIIIV